MDSMDSFDQNRGFIPRTECVAAKCFRPNSDRKLIQRLSSYNFHHQTRSEAKGHSENEMNVNRVKMRRNSNRSTFSAVWTLKIGRYGIWNRGQRFLTANLVRNALELNMLFNASSSIIHCFRHRQLAIRH